MVLSLYWGVVSNVKQQLYRLPIAVVSFDGQFAPYEGTEPIVGNAVIAAARHAMTLPDPLGYIIQSPAEYNNDPLEVRRWVSGLNGWGAIIINNNASALLRQAVEKGDASYDPLGAAQIIYEQARDLETINQYVAPVLIELGRQVVTDFGTEWTRSVFQNSSLHSSSYTKSPQALSPAIGFSIFNLRPFDPPAAIPSVTIGLIYLIIIAFFSFGFFLPVHLKFTAPLPPPNRAPVLKFSHLVIWRWLSTIFAYLLLSLSYSLVSLAFRIPFNNPPGTATTASQNPNPFGAGTFLVYWMVNWVGMIALGMASENVGMVIGVPWVGLWLIFWVISNVATGFYALELAPAFYGWGYIWPLHSLVEAARTVLFDTKHFLGKDFGILIAWCVLNSIVFPYACRFARWKTMRAARKGAPGAGRRGKRSGTSNVFRKGRERLAYFILPGASR